MEQPWILASFDVGLATILVHVVATPNGLDQMTTQIVENDLRRPWTDNNAPLHSGP